MIKPEKMFKNKKYKRIDGVYVFVKESDYVKSFGMQWDIHRTTQLQHKGVVNSDSIFFEKTGLKPKELKGKKVLDAGCGIGRFIDTIQRHGGEAFGCDLSKSVFAAKENCPTATIVQADIFKLPFKDKIFDIIYSIGVLHHTPKPQKAFESLIPLLKKGGKLCIWLYPDNPKVYSDEAYTFLRRLFQMLPLETQYEVCKALAPPIRDSITYGRNELGIPENIFKALAHCINMNPDDDQCILDTFDWNSCKYQWKYTWKEAEKWFKEGGLKHKRLKTPISIQGVKK